MKKWMIALVVALGIASGAFVAPTAANAQTLYETLNLAADAEAAAKKLLSLASRFQTLANEAAKDGFPKNIAPTETEVLKRDAEAARKAVLRQARAYELMAATLRDHARTLR